MEYIDKSTFQAFENRKRARFINSLSGFKSANLIGTKDQNGLSNLSIISSAVHLGASPALIGIIFRPDVSPRHTLENIRQTKVCTLNHVNESIIKKAHQTSARYPKDISEFKACDLTEQYLEDHHAPFVKESAIKLALRLVREVPIEENGTQFLIMSIEGVYLPKEILQEDGFVNIEMAQTICVSGLDSYHTTEKKGRLNYAKPDKSPFYIT